MRQTEKGLTPTFEAILARRGMTLAELERRAGTSRNACWRYKAGKRSPRVRTLLRLAEALRTDVETVARSLVLAQDRYRERREQRRKLREAMALHLPPSALKVSKFFDS